MPATATYHKSPALACELPAWCRIVRDFNAPEATRAWDDYQKLALSNVEQAYLLLHDRLTCEEVETAAVVLFDDHMNVIACQEIGRGTVNQVTTAPREVFRLAVGLNAARVLFAHHHPNGDVVPSTADRLVTANLRGAGKVLGIELEDSLVITRDAVQSLRSGETIKIADLRKRAVAGEYAPGAFIRGSEYEPAPANPWGN